MKTKHIICKSLLATMMAAPMYAWATPPAGSPYFTDPQNSYVEDLTSDGLSQLNTVLCVMNAMDTADMVNKGPYIALVDMNKCDKSKQSSASNSSSSSSSSGATSAANYINAVVDVTRTDNSTPMLAKIWMSMTQQGQPFTIYVHLTATTSPTALPPYGTFRMDYIGKSSGMTMFNGFIDANGTNISYLENDASSMNGGSGASTNALAMTSSSTSSGVGTMDTPDHSTNTQQTFNFAYDSSEANFPKGVYRRDDMTSSTDLCFDRNLANVTRSTWNYGTYNDNDGTHLDTANPGFPVLADDGVSTYYGYANYWGINFQGLDLSTKPDGLITGVTVTDQRPGNTTTYDLYKNGGKLTKWTQNKHTLQDIDGIPFDTWIDLTGQTTGNTLATGSNDWEFEWDNTNQQFVVLGYQTCGNNGCTMTALSPTATVNSSYFSTQPINGYSNSFGGNINIPMNATASAHIPTDEVDSYTQTDVLPGDTTVPANLYCVSYCPSAASLTSFNNGSSTTPFYSTTGQQYGSGPTSSTVTYSFGSVNGLMESSTALDNIVSSSMFTGQYQYGIQSGRLFPALVTGGACPSGYSCAPNSPTVYYTWQTGADQWNQSEWLVNKSTNTVVSFDPPQNVNYTVPKGTAYGKWAGKTIQLQFSGFGNLQGIPSHCVNPVDNSTEDCSIANARWVPDFSIPDGDATMSLTIGGTTTPMIVKSLDSEVRLANIPSCQNVTLAQPLTAQTLPSATQLHDPSSSTDTDYIGTQPTTASSTPSVIDGVIQ